MIFFTILDTFKRNTVDLDFVNYAAKNIFVEMSL